MKSLAHSGDATELVRRLRQLNPDSRPRWGRMSAHQMVCHVADAMRMALGTKAASPAGGIFHRTVLKWLVLWVPLRWPRGILTRPELDQLAGGTRPEDFAADLAQVEVLLSQVASDRSSRRPPHPLFGHLSDRAWLRWAYLHTDHHLRQFGL